MALQSSAQVGAVIRNAAIFNLKNWNKGMSGTDSLLQSVQSLFALLEERQIDYVLVGGIALLVYVEGRNTQDIDLLMAQSSLEKLPELVVTGRENYFARASYGELQVDVLLTKNPLFKKVLKQYTHVQRFLDREIPLVAVEGLILLKLYALPSLYRQADFARAGIYENDVATLLYTYQPDTQMLIKELSAFLDPGDLTEIQAILGEIQDRIARFKKNAS